MDDAIKLEVNLLVANEIKQRNETRKVKGEAQASTSQSNPYVNFDKRMQVMEKLMDKLYVDDKNQNRDQNDPQIRNPNFRRPEGPPVPQIMKRG